MNNSLVHKNTSIEIMQSLQNARINLSQSKFSDANWHQSSPSYQMIYEELLTLDQSNKNPIEKILIKAEIISLTYQERNNANELVINSVLEALELTTSQTQHQFNTSSTEESSLAGESDETNGNNA